MTDGVGQEGKRGGTIMEILRQTDGVGKWVDMGMGKMRRIVYI
jgi:hypothetical protein